MARIPFSSASAGAIQRLTKKNARLQRTALKIGEGVSDLIPPGSINQGGKLMATSIPNDFLKAKKTFLAMPPIPLFLLFFRPIGRRER